MRPPFSPDFAMDDFEAFSSIWAVAQQEDTESSAFQGIIEASSALKFKSIVGELLTIRLSKDSLPAAWLVLPEVVEVIQQKLGYTASDDLVVIPVAVDTVFVTKTSSAMACCILGDMASRYAVEHPEYVTSIPFRVFRINKSGPPEALISQGVTPVLWEFYPCWGRIPLQGITTPEGKVCFPVPGSLEQAMAFSEAVKAGAKPSVAGYQCARMVDDDGKQPEEGCCAGCFKFGNFNKCARCKRTCYCSRECQKSHWKLHKHQCGS